MKHWILLFLCCSAWANWCAGQERALEVSHNTPFSDLAAYSYIAKDESVSGSDAPIPFNARFVPFESANFDSIGSRYWMRFTLTNKDTAQLPLQLFLGLSENLYFFRPEAGGYRRYSIGIMELRSVVSIVKGAGKTFLSQAVVELKPGETQTIYAQFHHTSRGFQAKRDSKISARLLPEKVWVQYMMLSRILMFSIFGCFLFVILYHLVYYFLAKDRLYLYYCLFVFAVAFPFLSININVVDNPRFDALIFFGISGLFSVFYFQFLRKLIDLKAYLPVWDRILKFYILLKSALVAFYTLAYIFTNDIFVMLGIYLPTVFIEAMVMLVLMVPLLRTKNRLAYLFVIGSILAWLGLMIAIVLNDPTTGYTIQVRPFKQTIATLGFLLQALFFAVILAYRARQNELEKKKAQSALIDQLQANKELQEKVNRELEEKVQERTNKLNLERQKSEGLLLNLLPEVVAQEMKETGKTVPQRYESATVLFSDIVNFTAIAESLTPEELVEQLNFFFSHFDAIALRHGLEKIKTIGDAYVCAGGLPKPDPNHLRNTIKTALEIQAFLSDFNAKRPESDQWRIRIGIHTGPVMAGVIGSYKFSYDIWGDTVNTAARMEQHSEGGKINITEHVYELVKEEYRCQPRGSLKVKNKGEMKMYFLEGTY